MIRHRRVYYALDCLKLLLAPSFLIMRFLPPEGMLKKWEMMMAWIFLRSSRLENTVY